MPYIIRSIHDPKLVNGSVRILDFVDEATGLNLDNDSTRRRYILLFRKLFGEESLHFDDPTIQVFFDFFMNRLSDSSITEEVLKAMTVITQHYPSIVDVLLPLPPHG